MSPTPNVADTRNTTDLANEIITALSAEHRDAFQQVNQQLEELRSFKAAVEAQQAANLQSFSDTQLRMVELLDRLERGMRIARENDAVRINAFGMLAPAVSDELSKFFIDHTQKDRNVLVRELSTTVGSEGGFLIPEDRAPEILRLLTAYGVARANGLIVPMRSNERVYPTLAGGIAVNWVLENNAAPESQPSFGEVRLIAKSLVGLTHASNQLFEDADADLGALLTDLFTREMAREEDHQFFTGNSGVVVTDPFKGWLYEAGVNNVVTTGRNAFTQVTADDALALTGAVPSGSLNNARFYLHRSVLDQFRKLKDAQGNYIWAPMSQGAPGTIWGYPYTLVEVMPSVAQSAAATPFVAFGDARNVYLGVRKEIEVARSVDFAFHKNQTFIRFVERCGVKVAQPAALAKLTTAP